MRYRTLHKRLRCEPCQTTRRLKQGGREPADLITVCRTHTGPAGFPWKERCLL